MKEPTVHRGYGRSIGSVKTRMGTKKSVRELIQIKSFLRADEQGRSTRIEDIFGT